MIVRYILTSASVICIHHFLQLFFNLQKKEILGNEIETVEAASNPRLSVFVKRESGADRLVLIRFHQPIQNTSSKYLLDRKV